MDTAYNSYSHFYVGAAILSKEGEIITGSNVENAAYGSTICAEDQVILRANAIGIRCFDKLAIITRVDFDKKEVISLVEDVGKCYMNLLKSLKKLGNNNVYYKQR